MATNVKTAGGRSGRSQKRGPLRMITRAISFEPGIRTRVLVELECGHTTRTYEGSVRARCEACAFEKK